MTLKLYAHPFSSYCQKALIALYENETPFTFEAVNLGDVTSAAALERLWPLKKMPVLVDDGQPVAEASVIIEHLDINHRGKVPLLPDDRSAALNVRFLDRFMDIYVHNSVQTIVGDALRPADAKDSFGVKRAHAALDTAYSWLDSHLKGREWAADKFGLADCSAAPSLFYGDWVHPIGPDLPNLRDYRQRLNARPSYARCIEEARPFRHFFPLGAPDRD